MNPKIKIKKAVMILACHLTEKTLSEYIYSETTECGAVKPPKKKLPWDVYVYTDVEDDIIPIIHIMTSTPINETDTDENEPIPKDLLDLINWGIKNNIEYIQLDDLIDKSYGDKWKEHIEIESELPIYDCPVTE